MPAGLRTDGIYYQPAKMQTGEGAGPPGETELAREMPDESSEGPGQAHERDCESQTVAIVRSTLGGGSDRIFFIAQNE